MYKHIHICAHIYEIVTVIISSAISKTCKQYLKAQRQNNISKAISSNSKYIISNLKVLQKTT